MTPWFFSESIDYLKILGNPWINWFLNFPYDSNLTIFVDVLFTIRIVAGIAQKLAVQTHLNLLLSDLILIC